MAYDYVTDDVIPCLNPPGRPSPVDLPAYRDVVLERFGNPAIRDTNQRVAMDGFSKIPGFIAPTVRERLARARASPAWRCCRRCSWPSCSAGTDGTLPYAYQDQGMDEAAAHAICDAADPVAALCADRRPVGRRSPAMRAWSTPCARPARGFEHSSTESSHERTASHSAMCW